MGRCAVDPNGEEGDAPGVGEGQLGEAPLRLPGSRAVEEHDGVRLPQPRVELALPVTAGRDPLRGIEVEEERAEAAIVEEGRNARRTRVVLTAVADEQEA